MRIGLAQNWLFLSPFKSFGLRLLLRLGGMCCVASWTQAPSEAISGEVVKVMLFVSSNSLARRRQIASIDARCDQPQTR